MHQRLPFPMGWNRHFRKSIPQVLSITQFNFISVCRWAPCASVLVVGPDTFGPSGGGRSTGTGLSFI
ncbi:MAG: hypothetical protein O7H41_21370 [Planctomycetota bacterium]|nr:hypothetical protein [Planctomycetota bacterium]